MIAPTPFFSHRGTHIRILEEARALERRSHHVTVVTYHVGDDIHSYIDTTVDVRRIRRWLFWYKKTAAGADWQKIILNLFLIRKVLWMTLRDRPDIIHGHLHEGIIIAHCVRKVFFWRKIRVVADFHGSLVGEMRSHGYLRFKPLAQLFRLLERVINTMGHVAVVSSADHVATIKAARKDHRVYHIYDGVDAENYDHLLAQKSQLRMQYKVPTEKTVVVYTGGLVNNKGIGEFLEAADLILKKRSDIFFIVGGDSGEWVEEFVQARKRQEHFLVLYPLNYFSLPEVNTMADITVDPKDTASKQASGKILQYMAAATATICADRKTNRSYLAESGTYVERSKATFLADEIVNLSENPAVRSEKSRIAKDRSREFSWHKVGEKLEGVYLSV